MAPRKTTQTKTNDIFTLNPETGEITIGDQTGILRNAITGHPIIFDNTGRLEK